MPKEQPPVSYEEPSLERCFMDCMARKPYEEAQKLIDSGGGRDDARKLMDDFCRQHKGEPRISCREAVLQPLFRVPCDALMKCRIMPR